MEDCARGHGTGAKTSTLANFGLFAYPTTQALSELEPERATVKTTPIETGDITEDFSNTGDLAWLRPFAVRSKVVMLGEDHYIREIHLLERRILFALNQYDDYSLILLESDYSASPFVDYYVGIADDDAAAGFYRTAVYEFVHESETSEFIQHIRRWNKVNPGKRIHIGFHDIEHNFRDTLRRVIAPYFLKVDSSWRINVDSTSRDDLAVVVERCRKLLKTARAKAIVGDYPFITADFVETVIDNLESLHWAYRGREDGRNQFDYYRQKAIVRNITDPRFFGDTLVKHKAVICAGASHTATSPPMPSGGNFLREGLYLAHDYQPTRGRVYSLRIAGIAVRALPPGRVDWTQYLSTGTGFRNLVESLQKAAAAGLTRTGHYYGQAWAQSPITLFFARAAADCGDRNVKVDSIDWEAILRSTEAELPNSGVDVRDLQRDASRYDDLIVVPKSSIVTPNRRRAEPGGPAAFP